MPEWAASEDGSIVLTFLHRNTAKVTHISLKKGDEVDFKYWHIRLLGLAHGLRVHADGSMLDDMNVENPAAFVELQAHGLVVYQGWLYRDFPELFGLDNPDWKVWLKAVTFRDLSNTGD